MKWVGIILPIILAVMAWHWVPMTIWAEMNQGLLAFLGLLSAALVQVIPVTANFLQSDRLTPEEAGRLSVQLTKQQRYWIGLLASTITTFVVVVIVSVLKDRTKFPLFSYGEIDIGPACSCLVAFSLSFVLLKMIGIFQGVISLQHLRGELVMNAAKRNASEQAKQAQNEVALPEQVTAAGYGSIIRPH